MRKNYYNELNGQLLFSVFDSSKKRKTNQFRIHNHTELEIGYIISGKGTYMLNNISYDISPDDIFIVRTNEQHCIPTITTESLVSFNIHIPSYYLWNICSDYIEPQKINALVQSDIQINNHFSKSEELKMLRDLFHENPEANKYKIRSTVLDVVKSISARLIISGTEREISVSRLDDIQKAVRFIKTNFDKQITLDDIANSAAMSKSYFINMFKNVNGVSPYDYLILTRIENASYMLSHTDNTIIEIAMKCGFNSITSFNKAFKSKLGLTPSQVRKH